jgi:hypothetical protein
MARVRCALALLLALAVAGGASAQLFPAGTALPTWADLFGADEVPDPLPKNAYRGTYVSLGGGVQCSNCCVE